MEEKECELVIIQQGDQYFLPFKITADGTEITPDSADNVIIKVGNISKKYSDGDLLFDNEWLFPLTGEITQRWKGRVHCQARYKKDDVIRSTKVYSVKVDDSIITEDF